MTDQLIDNPVEWGRKLILTNDHDPLYVGLTRWDVKGSRLRRFMLAYWCCYSVGASWFISQKSGSRFWDQLLVAASNLEPSPLGGRWPRAHERRHWRGQKCVDSVIALQERFKHPEEAVISLESCRTLNQVEKSVGTWPQFGPWISWKAADMLERVLGVPIKFSEEVVTLYKDPLEAAEMIKSSLGLSSPQDVVGLMSEAYRDIIVPGAVERPVNVAEIETVLCKYKSTVKGHYFLGKDTQDHKRELSAWSANDLLEAYP